MPRRPQPERPSLPPGPLPAPPPPRGDQGIPAVERYDIYFTGIGGTGVVTANRVIAAAARADGLAVGGLDQTGLSQKAGAVVSHLHLARDAAALGPAAVSAAADLYLSGDILQAASPAHLARTEPGRTAAVVDRRLAPTAAMLQTGAAPPALTVLEKAINERVGHSRAIFIDSSLIAERVFADHLLANVILLGAAFQAGRLPVSLASLEQALADLGPASPEAFAWGRWAVHDPAAVTAALPPVPGQQPSSAALAAAASALAGRDLPAPLAGLLVRRAAQAADYQDARRAGRYLDLVERVAARDSAGRDWALTRAVAESWFRLLTYKDEYEVARLHLAADYGRVARDLGISGPYRVTYHLHPPVLRRLGLARKLPLGRPYEVAFRVLRRMRRLRGTPLDPFGWDRDRRAERALIGEYERLLLQVAGLPYDTQVRIAASALSVKGYGPVKEKALAAWRASVAELRGETGRP